MQREKTSLFLIGFREGFMLMLELQLAWRKRILTWGWGSSGGSGGEQCKVKKAGKFIVFQGMVKNISGQ